MLAMRLGQAEQRNVGGEEPEAPGERGVSSSVAMEPASPARSSAATIARTRWKLTIVAPTGRQSSASATNLTEARAKSAIRLHSIQATSAAATTKTP